MPNEYRHDLRDFLARLGRSGFPPEVKAAVARHLAHRIETWSREPDLRDGRGLTHAASKVRRRTLQTLGWALRHEAHHPDGEVRRRARKLIRTAQLPFAGTIEGARRFVGALRRSGRRRMERERRRSRPTRKLQDGLRITQLTSSAQLREAGRALGLCVGRRSGVGREYHASLTSGASLFFELRREDAPIGLMMVETEARKVEHVEGAGGGELKLRRREALDMVDALDIDGDAEETFSRVGAFRALLRDDIRKSGWLPIDPPYEVRLHCSANGRQLIVCTARPTVSDDGQTKRVADWALFAVESSAPRRRGRWTKVPAARGRARARPAPWPARLRAESMHDGAMQTRALGADGALPGNRGRDTPAAGAASGGEGRKRVSGGCGKTSPL